MSDASPPRGTDRIRQAAMSRRSSLYRWMVANHDEFSATLAEAGRPNWKALADAFAAEGLTDSEDKAPSAEGARQTWWRVRKAVEARRAKAKRVPVAPLPGHASPIQPAKDATAAQTEQRRRFQISTPKPPKLREDE